MLGYPCWEAGASAARVVETSASCGNTISKEQCGNVYIYTYIYMHIYIYIGLKSTNNCKGNNCKCK
jgi:hypothetical protein